MNQNKTYYLIRYGLGLIFLLIACFLFHDRMPHPAIMDEAFRNQTISYPEVPAGANYTTDAAYSYSPEIEGSKTVTNWHSSFFVYEGRALKWFLQTISGRPFSDAEIVAFMWYMATFVLLLCVFIFYIQSVKSRSHVCVQIAMGISLAISARSSMVSLDYFFLTSATLSVLTCILARTTKRKWVRIVSLCILSITLINMVNYRKNAILIAPCFFIFAIHSLQNKKIFKLCALYFLYIVTMIPFALSLVVPVKKTFPTNPMIESDIRIAAILRGEQLTIRKKLKDCGFIDTEHYLKDSIAACSVGDYITGVNIDQEKLLNLYLEEWKNHTSSMLVAKSIQVVEFYTAGVLPGILQKTLINTYPALKSNRNAMMFHAHQAKIVWIPRMALFILLSWISLCSLSIQRKSKTSPDPVWLVSTISVLYAASYLIVTPTPDMRYLTPSVVLGFPAAVLYVSDLLKRRRQNTVKAN